MQINRKKALYFAFSAVVTVSVFGYLLTTVSPREVAGIIRGVDLRGVVLFAFLSIAMSVFRTWRYGILVKAAGHGPPFSAMFLVVLVRNLFSDLLPARIGGLIYVYILTGRLGVPFAAAMSSFALSFLFDVIAMVPLMVLAAFWAGGAGQVSSGTLIGAGVVLLALVVVLIRALPSLMRAAGWMIRRAPLLGERRRERWSGAFGETVADILKVREAGIYFRLVVLSVFVRLGKYGALYFLLFGLLAPLGYRFEELNVARVFLGICSSELAASMPVSGIAGFGMYEGVWATVFSLLGFPAHIAKLTSISHHLVTQVFGYSLGAAALVALLLPFFRGRSGANRGQGPGLSPVRFYGRVVAAAAAAALAAAALYSAMSWLGNAGKVSTVESSAVVEETIRASGLHRDVVFDSNRGGTFGIHILSKKDGVIRTVCDTAMTEIYPDPSPDGALIVFARAKSPHRLAPSEIWVCGIDGSGERKVADNGTFPTFGRGGDTVYFERDRRKVMAVDLDGSNERQVFPRGGEEFARHRIVKPRVSPDGRWVAFISDRKGAWNTWIGDLETGESRHVAHGCEPAWFPGSTRLAWIRQEGVRQGAGIFAWDLQSGKTRELHDAGPPLGHEYFPTVSADGRFLLWGACPEGQHAHETSSYQLFIKDLTSGEVTRLTDDSANSRWPKLLPGG
ncbi:MAG: flippase-like domain-containing protein [Lentisphaerae bacterium]|nr:flippase-like domain-containing protein [Lentisphaerota bacterium]